VARFCRTRDPLSCHVRGRAGAPTGRAGWAPVAWPVVRTGSATVAELLAHGGWLLDDARARAAANPDTFHLPRDETLARVVPGTQVRVIVQVADQADPVIDGLDPYDADGRPNLVVGHERVWLWVLSLDGPDLDASVLGVLANDPVATHTRLRPGAQLRVPLRQVIDVVLEPRVSMADELSAMAELGFPLRAEAETVAPEDPLRLPTIDPAMADVAAHLGVRPERPYPAPFVRALIGRTVADGVRPLYGGRGRPRPDRGDSGWTIWAGEPDMHAASERDGFDIVPIPEVRARSREVWSFLALPPGWAFVLAPDDTVDLYEDPDLLA